MIDRLVHELYGLTPPLAGLAEEEIRIFKEQE